MRLETLLFATEELKSPQVVTFAFLAQAVDLFAPEGKGILDHIS